MTRQSVLSFIGAGNIATSLISGLIMDGYQPDKIWAADIDKERLKHIEKNFSIHTTTNNLEAVKNSDAIVLCLKPQTMKPVLLDIAKSVQEKKTLIVSIAAGIQTQSLNQYLGEKIPIVRCMPNTPALIQVGASGLFANQYVSDSQKNLAESIIRAVGITVWVHDEKLMDVITALSGSGPAYFFMVMEALKDAAIALGLEENDAHLLTIQTALGASRMALETNEGIELLRKKVTSPGGTTESALEILMQADIKKIFAKALSAAKMRAEELGKTALV